MDETWILPFSTSTLVFSPQSTFIKAAFFNARVPGTLFVGVTDDGKVVGVQLGPLRVKRKWMDECVQMFVSRARSALLPELDPALATVQWNTLPVTRHPHGPGHYVVCVSLVLSAAAYNAPINYLIRYDTRDEWFWPLKVGVVSRRLGIRD